MSNNILPPQPLFDTLDNLKITLGQTNHQISLYILSSGIGKAQEDYRHALEFLYSYRGSKDTFASYRREVERLLQWSWFINKTSLSQLKRLDIEHFIN